MSRNRARPTLGYKIFYVFAIVIILVVWGYAFRAYFSHYDSMHPEIAWALPWVEVDSVIAKGVFLWNETKIPATSGGTVHFPKGLGPLRVPKGTVVARVSSGRTVYDVKSPIEGYFVAGVDGMEGKWRYSMIWPGTKELPEVGEIKLLKDGSVIQKGAAVGKVIPQPQDLRFIGYADITDSLSKELALNKVTVKMDRLDTPSKAQVRVCDVIGYRVKLYLNMPWFPPNAVMSRNYNLIIEAGETSGVAVPESSVVKRKDIRGVFILRGSNAAFQPVKGRPISGGKFLVTEGIRLGDAVIVNGEGAREGKVKLW